MAGAERSDPQQSHLGGRIEAQAEEHAHRIHLPTAVRHPEQRAEEATHEPTLIQRLIYGKLILLLTILHLPKRPVHIHQDHDINGARYKHALYPGRVVAPPPHAFYPPTTPHPSSP